MSLIDDDQRVVSEATGRVAGGAHGAGAGGAGAEVEVRAAVEVLLSVDLPRCGFDELDVVRGASQRLRSFVASVDLRVARRNDELIESWLRPAGGSGDGGSDGDGAGGSDAGGSGTGAGDAGGDGAGGSDAGSDADDDGAGEPGDGSAFGGTRDCRSDAEVARDRARGQVCELMPAFEIALGAGRIDVAHVDAVVAALGRIDVEVVRDAFVARADELVRSAGVESPERFRRRCSDMARQLLRAHGVETTARQKRAANVRSWWNRGTGMFHLHLEVEPELGAKLEAAIDQRIAARRDRATGETFQRLKVEAVAEMMLASSALDPRAPEIVVLIDHDTLRTGLLSVGGMCESVGGGELSPDTVRRLACDAGIVPVVMGGDGVPIDVGRKERVATTAQRRALRAMYRTCAHPGCTKPFNWCRMHHVVFWDDGGETNLEVLLPLCDEHHHQVHEGGWTLTMTPDRVCTWVTPSGQVWFSGDTRDGAEFASRCPDDGSPPDPIDGSPPDPIDGSPLDPDDGSPAVGGDARRVHDRSGVTPPG